MAEEQEKTAPADETDAAEQPGLVSRIMMALTMGASLAIGIGLFVLLPAWVVDWLPGSPAMTAVTKNVIEGGMRLVIIVAYILGITLMPYIRRVFEYHGAEHTTINCHEAGQEVTLENCARFSPLHRSWSRPWGSIATCWKTTTVRP